MARRTFNGVASILIGVLLLVVAGLLLRETKSLLPGEPAEPKLLQQVADLVGREPAIVYTAPPLSSYLSPHEILVVLPVEFAPALPAAQLTQAAARRRAAIRAAHPDVQHVFIQPTTREEVRQKQKETDQKQATEQAPKP